MRLVLDSNVVVSGMLWHGAPRQLLQRARVGQIHVFTSPALLSELDETLRYAKLQDKIAASGQSVQRLVALYTALFLPFFSRLACRILTILISTRKARNAPSDRKSRRRPEG